MAVMVVTLNKCPLDPSQMWWPSSRSAADLRGLCSGRVWRGGGGDPMVYPPKTPSSRQYALRRRCELCEALYKGRAGEHSIWWRRRRDPEVFWGEAWCVVEGMQIRWPSLSLTRRWILGSRSPGLCPGRRSPIAKAPPLVMAHI